MNKDNINSVNKIFMSLCLSLFLFLLTHLVYGFHYGWVDDVTITNFIRGLYIAEARDKTFTVHVGLSRIYHYLYLHCSNFPWYGLIICFYAFLATFNLVYFLSCTFDKLLKKNTLIFILLTLFIFILIWVENIFLLNFTRISILLIGTSFLLIDHITNSSLTVKQKYLWTLYLSIVLLIGILTRPESVIVLIVPFLFYFFRHYKSPRTLFKIFLILALNGIISGITYTLSIDSDIKQKNKNIAHILSITDGMNTNQKKAFELINEDIRYKAVFLYYIPDDDLVNEESLKKWGSAKFVSTNKIIKSWHKLRYEIYKARLSYGKEYLEKLNWFNLFIGLLIFNFLLCFLNIVFSLRENKLIPIAHFLAISSFTIIIILITVLYKMENRVTIPSIAIISLMGLSMISKSNIKNRFNDKAIAISLFLLLTPTIIQSINYYKISLEKKKETELKRNFINELNQSFENKIIFYDIWTMSLIHLSPFEVAKLNSSNMHTNHKENWSGFISDHVHSLEKMCGNTDFVNFYNCLFLKKEDVVFVFTKDTRIGFIEEYALKVHNINMEFSEILDNSELKKINYTFLPHKYEFGYFTLKSFEKIPQKNID